jgi:aminotransferase
MNNNISKIEISGIRKFFNKVSQVPEALSLTLGQPDFNTPDRVKEAMVRAINENKTSYTSNMGLNELREQISSYLETMKIHYTPEEICITVGGSEGLFAVFNTLINRGDKVIIPDPAYPAYDSITKLLGGEVLSCELNEDFSLNLEVLEGLIRKENPKLLVLSYPSNPTGAALKKEDRNRLHDIIIKSGIYVISDEIYSAIYFEEEYYSLAQFSDIRDRVILVSGFSKMLSMTGLRIGYLCAVPELMKEIVKVHQYSVSCAPSISQWGAYEGLKSCLNDVEYMREQFYLRRDYVYQRLKSLGMEVNLPQGAFYIFPSIKGFKLSSEEFCDRLLREGKVAFVPGSAFGRRGEGNVRISYSYSQQMLETALNRFEGWIGTNYK